MLGPQPPEVTTCSLTSTWRSRETSPKTVAGTLAAVCVASSSCLVAAFAATKSAASSRHWRTLKGADSSSRVRASILLKSRMSLICRKRGRGFKRCLSTQLEAEPKGKRR